MEIRATYIWLQLQRPELLVRLTHVLSKWAVAATVDRVEITGATNLGGSVARGVCCSCDMRLLVQPRCRVLSRNLPVLGADEPREQLSFSFQQVGCSA